MPKRGNWGDWAVIDLPPTEVKYVSCYACQHYCEEDGSCIKTSIIPRKDGNKVAWKNCSYFELKPEYMTYSFMETVRGVKGSDFFSSKEKHLEREVEKKREGAKALICDFEIGTWIKSDKFGTGRLVEIYPGKIVIDFQGKQRKFIYPDAFDNCLLFLVYPPSKEDSTEMTADTSADASPDSEIVALDYIEPINEIEQCADTSDIHIEKSDTRMENANSDIVHNTEEKEEGSSFIGDILGWIKRFWGR